MSKSDIGGSAIVYGVGVIDCRLIVIVYGEGVNVVRGDVNNMGETAIVVGEAVIVWRDVVIVYGAGVNVVGDTVNVAREAVIVGGLTANAVRGAAIVVVGVVNVLPVTAIVLADTVNFVDDVVFVPRDAAQAGRDGPVYRSRAGEKSRSGMISCASSEAIFPTGRPPPVFSCEKRTPVARPCHRRSTPVRSIVPPVSAPPH